MTNITLTQINGVYCVLVDGALVYHHKDHAEARLKALEIYNILVLMNSAGQERSILGEFIDFFNPF